MATTFSRKNSSTKIKPEETLIIHNSEIYCFRDYWSNRLNLKKNIQTEDFNIDNKKDFLNSEFKIMHRSDGKCDLKGEIGRFTDLDNPYELLRKYEPHGISLPSNKSGDRDALPDPEKQLDEEQIENIEIKPIVQSKGKIKFWLRMFATVIAPTVLLTLLEWVIIDYLSSLYPWLIQFRLLIISITLGGLLFSSTMIFIRIGISEATRKVIRAKSTIYFYDGKNPDKLHYRYIKDQPSWLKLKPYWVFRYLFTWSFELTLTSKLPFIHAPQDVERIEIWLDARTGKIEWIVSDYHWRELWYRAEPALDQIVIWLAPNFHTPRPLNITLTGKETVRDLYRKENPLSKKWMQNLKKSKLSHSKFFKTKYKENGLDIFNKIVLAQLIDLWWEKLRYPLGADSEIYRSTPDFPSTGGQPS